jgi:hypothetical protein
MIRQVFVTFTEYFIEELKAKPTKWFFQSFVRKNGYSNVIVIGNRFPEDAKVIEIRRNFKEALIYVAIESKEYPLVNAPIELHPVISYFDSKPIKVQFT